MSYGLCGLGQRREDAVSQKHSQKRSDESGAHLLSHLLRRSANGLHGDDNPKHRRHDSERGHGISHSGEDARGLHGLLVRDLQVYLHKVGEAVDVHATHRDQLQGIRKQIDGVMVVEEGRILLEDLGLVGVLHVLFQLHQTLLPGQGEGVIHHLEQLQKDSRLVGIALQQPYRGFQHGNGALRRIADYNTAKRSSSDDDELGDLVQGGHFAAMHRIAAQNAAEEYRYAKQNRQVRPDPPSGAPGR